MRMHFIYSVRMLVSKAAYTRFCNTANE